MITHESTKQLYAEACELGEAVLHARGKDDLAPLIETISDFQNATARLAVALHRLPPDKWLRIADAMREAEANASE